MVTLIEMTLLMMTETIRLIISLLVMAMVLHILWLSIKLISNVNNLGTKLLNKYITIVGGYIGASLITALVIRLIN